MDDDPGFTRTRLPGLDLVTIEDPDKISMVGALPEVERLAAVVPDPDNLPWLFRWYMPKTRFYNPTLGGWFLPFRGGVSVDPTYAPCRAFLDARFAQPRDLSAYVSATVDLLMDIAGGSGDDDDKKKKKKKGGPSDRQLADVAIQAVWRYIVPDGEPPLDDARLDEADRQVVSPVDSFLPWKVLRGVPGLSSLYAWTDKLLQRLGWRGTEGDGGDDAVPGTPLPDPAVTDTAHVLLALRINAPPVLRRIAELRDEDADLAAVLSAVGPVERAPRMTTRESTLGGLLPDDAPALPRSTVVMLGIRAAAKTSGDVSYVFAAGPGTRECAARGVLEGYFGDVRDELIRRRAAAGAES